MMVYTNGDLFESPAKVLVNTVNTHGVMGKGIALRFRQIYPEMLQRYREHCERGSLTIGKLYLYKTPHKWILNFPTKEHWRDPSRAEYIEAGLRKFRDSHAEIDVTSVAFPMLGCGNGGLDFEDQIEPLMERLLADLPMPTLIHADRSQIGTAGQHDRKRIEGWLRSEPAAHPFNDVWRDIAILLRSRSEFMTGRSRFSVAAQDDPPMLHVTSANRSFRITGDELAGFWQQLRDCGLAHRRIAPDDRLHSFLVPVFGQLSYVRQIAVSESAAGLRTNPDPALQIIPTLAGDAQR